MAEHLDASVNDVSNALAGQASLNKTIESLSASSGRRLKNLEHRQSLPIDGASIVQDHQFLDPEAPIEFDRIMDQYVEDEKRESRTRRVIKIAGVLLFLLALAAAWRWTPLSGWINRENLAAWAGELHSHPMSFLGVLGAYVAGGLVMIPVMLLTGVTAMIYAPFSLLQLLR